MYKRRSNWRLLSVFNLIKSNHQTPNPLRYSFLCISKIPFFVYLLFEISSTWFIYLLSQFFIVSVILFELTNPKWCFTINDEYKTNEDNSFILSPSRNLTVHSNETILLPCIVKHSPNTIVGSFFPGFKSNRISLIIRLINKCINFEGDLESMRRSQLQSITNFTNC